MKHIFFLHLLLACTFGNAQLDTTGIRGSYNTTRKEVQGNFIGIDTARAWNTNMQQAMKDTAQQLRQSMPTVAVQSVNGQTGAVVLPLFSGSYADLTNKPTIPTNTNQLTNGSGYITTAALSPYLLTSTAM